jgi:hypothetical protein
MAAFGPPPGQPAAPAKKPQNFVQTTETTSAAIRSVHSLAFRLAGLRSMTVSLMTPQCLAGGLGKAVHETLTLLAAVEPHEQGPIKNERNGTAKAMP